MSAPLIYHLYKWKRMNPAARFERLNDYGVPSRYCADLIRRTIIVGGDVSSGNPRELMFGYWIPHELLREMVVNKHNQLSTQP